MRTPLCHQLGIEVPIILAPIIAPVGAPAGPRLAAAVSEAGGLGTIALWLAEIDVLRLRIREMNSLTSKPFAINLRLDLDAGARLDACLGEGVRIVSMFWGDPSKLAPRAKAGGAIVMQTVRSAEEARIAVDCGVDVVVAQGWEAGGHVWGRVATMALVPAVVDAVAPVPVIAAGESPMAGGWPLPSPLARRVSGSAPGSLPVPRPTSTHTTANDCWPHRRPTRSISRTCLMAALGRRARACAAQQDSGSMGGGRTSASRG